MQGANVMDKKSCKLITEKNFGHTNVELVPSLKETIQNPNNLIEDVASSGWIRGGLPSRELKENGLFQTKTTRIITLTITTLLV